MKRIAPLLLVVVVALVGAVAWWLHDPAGANLKAPTRPGDGGSEQTALATPAVSELTAPTATRQEERPAEQSDDAPLIDTSGPPGAIYGRILDPQGAPVSDAEVELVRGPAAAINIPSLYTRLNLLVRTDNAGKYRFNNVGPNDDYIIVASHPDYGDCEAGPIVVPPATEQAVADIRLRDGVTVEGFVRCDGRPLQNAVVILSNAMERLRKLRPNMPDHPDLEPFELRTATDAEGHYQFASAPFSSFEITAELDGYSRITRNSQTSFLGRSSREHKIDFDLTLARRITGSVIDESKNPIAGAKIAATIANQNFRCEVESISDGAGRFALEALADGQYFLQATCDGYSESHQQQVAAGTEELVLELRVQGSAVGVIVDESTGAPITEFALSVQQQYKGRGPIELAQNVRFHDSGGRFEVKNLDPGRYTLEGVAAGYAPSLSGEFEVTRGQVTSGVRIEMNKGGQITGIVVDRAGKPIRNALVSLRENGTKDNQVLEIFSQMGARGAGLPKFRTKEDGRFTLDLVVPETYQVAVRHNQFAGLLKDDVTVRKDETVDVGELVLLRGARVSGRAFDLDGNPLVGATITGIAGKSSGYKSTRTNNDGFYELLSLNAGEYTITINSFQSNPPINPLAGLSFAKNSRQVIAVNDGDDVTVDLRLSKEKPKE